MERDRELLQRQQSPDQPTDNSVCPVIKTASRVWELSSLRCSCQSFCNHHVNTLQNNTNICQHTNQQNAFRNDPKVS